jgi:hypothetical protein
MKSFMQLNCEAIFRYPLYATGTRYPLQPVCSVLCLLVSWLIRLPDGEVSLPRAEVRLHGGEVKLRGGEVRLSWEY